MTAYDIVIVGAGPAGMAAAVSATKSGASVAIVDDNHAPGGQIWRGGGPFPEFASCGAHFISGARVIAASHASKQLTVEAAEAFQIQYSKLILTTGARELFLPFPGWTLPGVFGVGGLQALAKLGLSVAGKRIIVAGTGPLLLAVAAYLVQHGASVPLIAEQAGWRSLAGFARALLSHPSKIRQAVEIRKSIWRTRYLPNGWVTNAKGANHVERITLQHNGTQIEEACDYLAIAYGFVPNSELAQLLGCEVSGGLVKVDQHQQTSIAGIYCAGEPTGLGGVDEALLEGEIAGYAAAHKFPQRSRKSTDHFSAALNQAFALRPELRAALTPDTIVCRCEDVPFAHLQQAHSWREAKLHYRCGMGPCQGRVCGPAVEYLFGWKPESIRPPIFPCRLENLISQETIHS